MSHEYTTVMTARPLPRHIAPRAKPAAPLMTMAEFAALENKAARDRWDGKPPTVPESAKAKRKDQVAKFVIELGAATNLEVADKFGITVATAKNYLKELFDVGELDRRVLADKRFEYYAPESAYD